MKNLIIIILTVIFSIFSYSINVPKIYTEKSMKLEGYEIIEKDINLNNGRPASKLVVYFKKSENNEIQSYMNIYEQTNNEYRLAVQSEKKIKYNFNFTQELSSYMNGLVSSVNENTKDLSTDEVREVEVFNTYLPDELNLALKYDKNSPKFNDFLFIKKSTPVNEKPVETSAVLETVSYPQKIKVNSMIRSNISGDWYEIELKDGKKGYVKVSENVEKRKFNWNKIVEKIDVVNTFITQTLEEKKKVYTISAYAPLSRDYYGEKDKFGNRPNQSIKGYKAPDSKEYVNIPDRTIFRLLGEKDGFYEIETPFYGGPYYIKANPNTIVEENELTGIITKFIVIDPESQSEAIIERDKDKWNVITYSFVTTGKDNGSSSYESPHGAFLIAYSKPVMQYTRNRKKDETTVANYLKVGNRDDLVISGEALFAVRFSGGGYLHGIPATYGGGTAAKKAYTGQKIGTYKESHKCVRHYDDQIKFIYDWLGDATPNDEKGLRKPINPTVAIIF